MDFSITKGNKKLPNTTLNWSLPPVTTCPFATTECKKWCYAKKAYRQYPGVRLAWEKNFAASLSKDFAKQIILYLERKRKWSQFRIHVSGDFYNQGYFDDWCNIANKFKQKVFYAYTKNYTLDLKKKPKNMILILSDDSLQQYKKWKGFDGISAVQVEKNYFDERSWFICPGDCKTCNKCYKVEKKNKRILFNIH